jgi:hypothetical protein
MAVLFFFVGEGRGKRGVLLFFFFLFFKKKLLFGWGGKARGGLLLFCGVGVF